MVPFVQLKKREKHPWKSVARKATLLYGCFSRFSNCTNHSKSRNPPLSTLCFPMFPFHLPWKELKTFGFLFSRKSKENIRKERVNEAVKILFTKYQLVLWITLITSGHCYYHFRRQRVFVYKLTDCYGGISDHSNNPLRPSVAFHIEASHVNDIVNQMPGFYMKRDTGLKHVNELSLFSLERNESHLAYCTSNAFTSHGSGPKSSLHTLFLWESVLHSPKFN